MTYQSKYTLSLAETISYLESSSLVAVSRPLVKGNEDAGYEGVAESDISLVFCHFPTKRSTQSV